MRWDTTVTEANLHYPTDSSLLGDGTRVLTRILKPISEVVGEQGTRGRDRLRTIGYRVLKGNTSGTGSRYITLRYNIKTFVYFYDFFRSHISKAFRDAVVT
jgi:hypothetical protein